LKATKNCEVYQAGAETKDKEELTLRRTKRYCRVDLGKQQKIVEFILLALKQKIKKI